jgi:hypothetical protein
MERTMVHPYIKSFITSWSLHDPRKLVFVVDVVVIDLMWETVALNVINWLTCAAMELNAIVKICKYRRFHERHHFILMAMEVHGAPKCDMDYFIKECARLFHDKQSRGHLSLSFCIQFFM